MLALPNLTERTLAFAAYAERFCCYQKKASSIIKKQKKTHALPHPGSTCAISNIY
jgi:hypothetical protein